MSKQINSFGEGLVSWRAYNREGGGVGVGAYQWGTYACKQQFNVYKSFLCITHLNFGSQSFCKYCGYY